MGEGRAGSSRSERRVFIEGGKLKEMVADGVHQRGRRRQGVGAELITGGGRYGKGRRDGGEIMSRPGDGGYVGVP